MEKNLSIILLLKWPILEPKMFTVEWHFFRILAHCEVSKKYKPVPQISDRVSLKKEEPDPTHKSSPSLVEPRPGRPGPSLNVESRPAGLRFGPITTFNVTCPPPTLTL